MTRDERLTWIARHISSVGVSYNGLHVEGGRVEPSEVAEALRELVNLRAEKARDWEPPPPPAWRAWLRRLFRRATTGKDITVALMDAPPLPEGFKDLPDATRVIFAQGGRPIMESTVGQLRSRPAKLGPVLSTDETRDALEEEFLSPMQRRRWEEPQ